MAIGATFGPTTTFFCFVFATLALESVNSAYFGKSLGKLSEYHHGVSGEVFAVDGRTLHIKDFTYDGQGPAAYFWAGTTRSVGNQGFRIRDENGRPDVLRRYRKEGVTITLPEGKTLRDIKWFSVWCEEFEVNFGDVKIPRNFDFPRPQKLAALHGIHGISSDGIVVVDAQTLLIPNLSYDGEAPDAKFWAGTGSKPTPQGIRVPNENGKETPLRRYDHKTIVLTLPGDLTIFDIGHFGIWCEAFTVDFGHVQVPAELNVPPSLKMLGVSPQSKLNCEVLYDDLAFEVRWAIAGESVVVQLVAKLDEKEYMSFGVSGDKKKTKMIGADVAVAWIDKDTLKGHAVDYYLQDKSQCSGPTGACPDEKFRPNTDSVQVLNAATVNGYTIITYQRPLKASDELDLPILTNETQAIAWAIGPLNQRNEVSFHPHYTKGDFLLDFGRAAKWNCPMPESEQTHSKTQVSPTSQKDDVKDLLEEVAETPRPSRNRNGDRRRGQNRGGNKQEDVESTTTRRSTERRGSNRGSQKANVASRDIPTPAPVSNRDAWDIPAIQCNEPEDGVFYAQMGPTGGKRGYPAITGHVGWGISWYINGLLIPEINLVRGKRYTFVVEGGLDPNVPARYHPFYITDDPIGGFEYKTPEEQQSVKIFAGTEKDGQGKVTPTGVGRLCHWTHQGDTDADDFESFGAYQRTLELKCDQGEPGVIQWTPDKNTPDTVYYQCFTHRYLGWKINVRDRCDLDSESSETKPVYAAPDGAEFSKLSDLDVSPSVQIETRIKPNDIREDGKKSKQSQNDDNDDLQTDDNRQFFLTPTVTLPYITSESFTLPPADTHLNQSSFDLPNPQFVDFTQFSRPIMPGRYPYVPSKILRRPVPQNRPPFTVKAHRLARPSPTMLKKTYYGPLMKMPAGKRPMMKENKPFSTMNSPMRSVAMLPPIIIDNARKEHVMNVEISPQQASTEREPNSTYEVNLHPAVNTGFHPETIVIEGGFKPIIRKEVEHRISNGDGPELEYESSIGVIDVQPNPGNLQPVFRPSPLDSQKKYGNGKVYKRASAKKDRIRLVFKRPRSQEIDDSEEDVKPEAAERVESYYLPPSGEKPIDKDSPPETVITYDGKKVSGASLSIRVNDRPHTSLESRTSKASEFLKSTPQFTLFKGELPPINQAFVDLNAPQLNSQGSLSRSLDTPELPPAPTKLRLVVNGEKELKSRAKRSPHHTPEHTEEQRRANIPMSSTNYLKPSYLFVTLSLVIFNVL